MSKKIDDDEPIDPQPQPAAAKKEDGFFMTVAKTGFAIFVGFCAGALGVGIGLFVFGLTLRMTGFIPAPFFY